MSNVLAVKGKHRPPASPSRSSALASLKAAEHLLDSAPRQAWTAAQAVLNAADNRMTRLKAAVVMADADLRLGQTGRALDTLRQNDIGVSLSPQLRGRIYRIQGQAWQMRGETDQAWEALHQAASLGRDSGDAALRSTALNLIAGIQYGRGESMAAVQTLDEVIALRAANGDLHGEIRSLCNRAQISDSVGEQATALKLLQRALSRTLDAEMLLYVEGALGMVNEKMGDLSAALAHFERARRWAQQIGNRPALATMTLNAGELSRKTGRTKAALKLLQTAQRQAERMGLETVLVQALHSLGQLHTARGQHAEAAAYLTRARQLAGTLDDLDALLSVTLGEAENALAAGQRGQAIRQLSRALSLASDSGRMQHVQTAHALLSQAYEATRPRKSLEHLRAAHAIEREQSDAAMKAQSQALTREAAIATAQSERRISESARREAEAQVKDYLKELERGRLYDDLTKLGNRITLKVVLDRALTERDHLAVAVLDLDRFKQVNDSFGQDVGDQMLRQVAERIGQQLGSSDLLTRAASDEFVMIFADVRTPEALDARVRDVMDIFRQEFEIEGQDIIIGASIGVARYPEHGESSETLLKNAQAALQTAKEGLSVQIFNPHQVDAPTPLSLESALARALERNEFQLHYQPLVRGCDGQVLKVEALLRWTSPTFGRQSPADFIPLLERTGLIEEVGAWVLREACAQAARRTDMAVAVNLSARQFLPGTLPGAVAQALKLSGLPGHRLELEITESLMIQSPERTARMLSDLKATGVRIVLDDFGTGYSNLGQLRNLPLDGLKIDRSFVRGIQEAQGRAVVAAIVDLARALHLQVTAEGIETPEDWAVLKDLNVDVLQGFYFGRPQPEWPLERSFLPPRPPLSGSVKSGHDTL